MRNIITLDCTLRDGGYVNEWNFGLENIKRVLHLLQLSEINIIECGFLSNLSEFSRNETRFNKLSDVEFFIPKNKKNIKYVCMINYGEFDISDIPYQEETTLDGIRIAFHKDELDGAINLAKELKEKGFLVFLQPMVTIRYSDKELLELVAYANEIQPYSLYIVDSFGVMKEKDLIRMFYLIDNNLNTDIIIGYHSHNNLQLSYSNAQKLITLNTKRQILIDSSVMGMGRGAGNLNTELFLNYLNENYDGNYKITPLLDIIDEVLNKIYSLYYWGYSLPHFLSASYNCHPNYATYLEGKNTLTVKAISDILNKLDSNQKCNYNKSYIEKLYLEYQSNIVDDSEVVKYLTNYFEGKNVLLVAPGSNLRKYQKEVKRFIVENRMVVIAINFVSIDIEPDFVFVSNLKRFDNINKYINTSNTKFIVTSNIKDVDNKCLIVNYNTLINNYNVIVDNAALMLIKLLIKVNIDKIYIAGFDGYSNNQNENYIDKDMQIVANASMIEEMNTAISNVITHLSKEIKIEFITPSKYNNT